jgi:hypothetical protein
MIKTGNLEGILVTGNFILLAVAFLEKLLYVSVDKFNKYCHLRNDRGRNQLAAELHKHGMFRLVSISDCDDEFCFFTC